MTSDPIHPAEKTSYPSPDEKNIEHIEMSPEDPKSRVDSPSEEWQESKLRLNLQMALAFVVGLYPENGFKKLGSFRRSWVSALRQSLTTTQALTMQFNAYILTLLIPSTTLATINAELGPDPNYTWITVSWTLAASIIVSVGGRLSDIFGRRYFMLFGASLSLVGCIVGATGQTINQMVASGVILGTGSGFQEMSYACIQEIVPNSWRLYAIGMPHFSFKILSLILF
jgi:hypothetical protein